MAKLLSKEEILQSPVRTKEVDAFGGTVLIRELDSLAIQNLMGSGKFGEEEARAVQIDFSKIDMAAIVARHIVGEDDLEPILSMAEARQLSRRSGMDVMKITVAAFELSGLTVEDQEVEITSELPEKN